MPAPAYIGAPSLATGLSAGPPPPSFDLGYQPIAPIASPGSTAPAAAPPKPVTTPIGSFDPSQPLAAVVKVNGVGALADRIIRQEGGSAPGVVNNPGNIKYTGLPGQTDSGVRAANGGTFASYPTPAAGRAAVAELVANAAAGKSPIYGVDPTFGDFMSKYHGRNPGGADGSLPPGYGEAFGQMQAALDEFKRQTQDAEAGSDKFISAWRDAQTKLNDTIGRMNAAISAPPSPPQPDIGRLGSVATIIGMVAGMFARQPLMGMLSGATGAMEGANQADWARYKAGMDQWKAQGELLLHVAEMQQNQLREIMEERNASLTEKLAMAKSFLTANQMGYQLSLAEAELPDKLRQTNTQMLASIADMKNKLANAAKNEAEAYNIRAANGLTGDAAALYRAKVGEYAATHPDNPAPDATTQRQMIEDSIKTTKRAGPGYEASKTLEILDKNGNVVRTVLARERRDAPGWVDSSTGQPLQLQSGQQVREITPSTASGGRAVAQVERQQAAGREVLSDLQNAVALPVGTTTGWLGSYEPGVSVNDAVTSDLVRALTPQDAQLMQASMASLTRELSILMSPVYGGSWASKQIDPLIPQSGDTLGVTIFKLARIAQSADNALEALSVSPIVSNDQKAYAADLRKKITEAIHWTPKQAMDFARQGQPGESFADFVRREDKVTHPDRVQNGWRYEWRDGQYQPVAKAQ